MTQFNKAEEKITFQQNQEVKKQRSLFLDADTFFLKTNKQNKTKDNLSTDFTGATEHW